MKKLISICVAALLVIGMTSMTGCKSTPQAVTFKTAATTSVTVEAALRAYDFFAAHGKTTVEQNQQVKSAYQKYQAAMSVVCDAGAVYAASASTNAPAASAVLQTAVANAGGTITDLINLITSFGVKL